MGIRKANSAGLVPTTAGPDLLHTIPVGRSFKVRKVMVYNPNAFNVAFQLGTQDLALVPAFVQLMPDLVALGLPVPIDSEWQELDLPNIEFMLTPVSAVVPLGQSGDLYVQETLAVGVGLLVSVEVEEFE